MLPAQQASILNDQSAKPAYIALQLPDTTYIQHFTNDLPDHISFDNRYNFSPKEYFERASYRNESRDFSLDIINPGVNPEADLPYQVEYSTDGTKIIVIYHHSNNVVVYNSEDLSVVADINVGTGPERLFVMKEHIYVACYTSNDIYVISMSDFAITNIIEVQEHPCLVEVNRDESILYAGFSIGEHLKYSCLIAYDLDSNEMLWESNWPLIDDVYMLTGTIGRKVYTMSDFLLMGNDQYIVAQKKPGMNAVILDAFTGEVVNVIVKSGENVANLKTSVTKDTLFMQTHSSDIMGFYQIDAYTHETIDSVIVSNPVPMVAFYSWQKTLGVNYNGSKMFLEVLNLYGEGISVVVDFETHTSEFIEHENQSLSQVNVIQSYDRRYVISMENDYRVFDFELGEYVFFENNISLYYNYKVMASSPTDYEFIWCDFLGNNRLTSLKKDETINVFNYDDPTNLHIDTTIVCGATPEADLTYDVVWDDIYDLIFTANPLSGTICITNALTYNTDTIIEMPGISSIEQVTDDMLLMGGGDHQYLELFDIPSRSVIKKFNLTDAHIILPSPDQQYVYAFSRSQSKLVKINLDGANSSIVKQLFILDNYGYYLNWEYSYSPAISPDGKYIVMGQENTAVIIDTESLEVVCNVPVAGDYVFDMAFSHDSKRVCLVYGLTDSRYDIVYLDGADSYLEHAIFGYDSQGSLSVAYSIFGKSFYIARENDIWVVEPVTGDVTDTLYLYPPSNQLQIEVDQHGNPMVLTYRHLHYGEETYYLGEPSRQMLMDPEHHRCIIPCPGPDRVLVLDLLTTEVNEIVSKREKQKVNLYPNPVSEKLTVTADAENYTITIYDCKGQVIMNTTSTSHTKSLQLKALPSGLYFVEVKGNGWRKSEKIVKR
jgi:YVTN family beta-propeller protein